MNFFSFFLSLIILKYKLLVLPISNMTYKYIINIQSVLNTMYFYWGFSESQFKLFTDLVNVDYPIYKMSIYNLVSLFYNNRILLKVFLAPNLTISSITKCYTCAYWFERKSLLLSNRDNNKHQNIKISKYLKDIHLHIILKKNNSRIGQYRRNYSTIKSFFKKYINYDYDEQKEYWLSYLDNYFYKVRLFFGYSKNIDLDLLLFDNIGYKFNLSESNEEIIKNNLLLVVDLYQVDDPSTYNLVQYKKDANLFLIYCDNELESLYYIISSTRFKYYFLYNDSIIDIHCFFFFDDFDDCCALDAIDLLDYSKTEYCNISAFLSFSVPLDSKERQLIYKQLKTGLFNNNNINLKIDVLRSLESFKQLKLEEFDCFNSRINKMTTSLKDFKLFKNDKRYYSKLKETIKPLQVKKLLVYKKFYKLSFDKNDIKELHTSDKITGDFKKSLFKTAGHHYITLKDIETENIYVASSTSIKGKNKVTKVDNEVVQLLIKGFENGSIDSLTSPNYDTCHVLWGTFILLDFYKSLGINLVEKTAPSFNLEGFNQQVQFVSHLLALQKTPISENKLTNCLEESIFLQDAIFYFTEEALIPIDMLD